ncbi:MAG: glycosyltransferase family protein, partial [Pseudomonadota bacterium]
GFFSFLNTLKRTVLVYGSNVERAEGNLIFKKNSEEEFLKDLASCRYVVCGAGHTLISEALYYGKPLVVFPIRNAFEQFLNAHYVVKCGYGLANDAQKPKLDQASEFESRLEDFTSHIARAGFCGNEDIFAWLRRYFETKKLPAFSDPS